MTRKLDLVVIGTGAAASTIASECRSAGWEVAVIDSRPFGGTCALRGCDPKKVLVGAAEVTDWSRRMRGKGVGADQLRIDWRELMEFKQTFTDPVPKHTEEWMLKSGIATFHGRARFVGATAVQVGDDVLEGLRVAIATGAKPAVQENSRDIEPIKGGHGDNYYYQMVNGIRRFKGARKPPAAGPETTIDIDGPSSAWNTIQPEYRDAVGDTFHRSHPGYKTVTRFVNTTGRNDLVLMKVARDRRFVYFYAKTADAITSHTDPNWMMLFIDIDRDHRTGWQGYDFVVNRRVKDSRTTFLEHTRTGWNWQPKAEVQFRVRGAEMVIAIPRQALGIGDGPIQFEFKWADNIQNEDSIDEFTLNGDAAPPGRFNYPYVAQ